MVYRVVVVSNGEETPAAIQALGNDTIELWIVGRRQGINQVLLEANYERIRAAGADFFYQR